MKYENYEKCKELVGQIEDLEILSRDINHETLHVRITNPYGNSIMTIDLLSNHPYKLEALDLVFKIREDISERISNLKKELIDL